MDKGYKSILRLFLNPEPMPGVFIGFTFLLGLIGSAFYEGMKAILSTWYAALAGAILFLLILIIITVLLRYSFHPKVVTNKIKPRRGLIVLVSQGELEKIPASEVIKFHYGPEGRKHPLEYCWLLRTPASTEEPKAPAQSSLKNANALEEAYKGRVKIYIKPVEMDDPESVSMAVEQAHKEARKLKLKESEMAADITGGTKPMSIGMALASIEAGVDMTYLKARKTFADGRADASSGSDLIRVDIEYFRRKSEQE